VWNVKYSKSDNKLPEISLTEWNCNGSSFLQKNRTLYKSTNRRIFYLSNPCPAAASAHARKIDLCPALWNNTVPFEYSCLRKIKFEILIEILHNIRGAREVYKLITDLFVWKCYCGEVVISSLQTFCPSHRVADLESLSAKRREKLSWKGLRLIRNFFHQRNTL
jgi:hypothetical protein